MYKNKKKNTAKHKALTIHKTCMIRKISYFLISKIGLEKIIESLNFTSASLSNMLPFKPLIRVAAYTLLIKEQHSLRGKGVGG